MADQHSTQSERQFVRCTCGVVRLEDVGVTRCSELKYSGCRKESQAAGVFTVDGGCHAILWHGPGHQSKARCELGDEPHEIHRGRVLNALIEWRGDESSTGFFNEPPEVD